MLKVEAVQAEGRLGAEEQALTIKMDALLAQKQRLEAELELVLGEILSTDQRLGDTRRCSSPR